MYLTVAALTLVGTLTWSSRLQAASCSDQPAWSSFSPGTSPSGRWHASAIWDSVNARLIVYGGYNGSNLGDVWSFSLGTGAWTQLSPSGTPPAARHKHSAIYDPVRHRMVICGGSAGNDVWALSLGASPAWTQMSTSGSGPSNAYDHVAIYDRHRDQMVVRTPDGYTYKLTFSNNTWSYITSGGLPVFQGPSGIYDPVNQRMIVFGGYDYATPPGYCLIGVFPDVYALSLSAQNPTWTYVGQAPNSFFDAVPIYDPQCHRMIVFGGTTDADCYSCSYWPYDIPTNNVWSVSLPATGYLTWTQLSPTGTAPAARSHHVGAFDPASNKLVTFGGGTSGTTCTYLNDVKALRLPDVSAPTAVDNLWPAVSCEWIALNWTAPGDDGTRLKATQYDLRKSTSPITEGNFGGAASVSAPMPGSPGTYEEAIDWVGECSWRWYYALKTADEQGNWSALSNVTPNVATPCPPPFCFPESGELQLQAVQLRLEQPTPNPAQERVRLRYSIPPDLASETVSLAVFDVSGRKVVEFTDGEDPAGDHGLDWDLRGSDGRALPRGTYFVRLRAGEQMLTRVVIVQ